MKAFTTVAALSVLSAVAYGQLDKVPKCALTCFIEALGSDGCESLTDFKCHCSKPELPGKIVPCIAKACPETEQATVRELVKGRCQQEGVPIDLGGEETPAPTSSEATAPSSTPAEAESSSAPAEASSTSATSSAYGTGSATPTGNGTTPATSTPSPYTGAATAPQAYGAAAVGLVAMVAAFAGL